MLLVLWLSSLTNCQKAEKNFAEAGVKLVTLSNYTELIKVAKVKGYITADGLQLLKKFKENQETWQD